MGFTPVVVTGTGEGWKMRAGYLRLYKTERHRGAVWADYTRAERPAGHAGEQRLCWCSGNAPPGIGTCHVAFFQ